MKTEGHSVRGRQSASNLPLIVLPTQARIGILAILVRTTMADVKEGRKRVAVVDNLIKRLRASGELNIQPVRHFGPKYGQRHNPYANGVKKYELTGVGIYREDIACSTTAEPNESESSAKSTTKGQKRSASKKSTRNSASSLAGANAPPRKVRRVPSSSKTALVQQNDFTHPASIVGHEMTSGDYLTGVARSADSLLLGIGIDSSCTAEDQTLTGGHSDVLVDVVQGDEAGQSDVYLCRLDNGFAQETTLQ